MSDLDKENNNPISAFAFNVGREVERVVNERTNNLEYRNKMTDALILDWFQKTKDKEFAKHFNLVTK